jgi:hypothetical protein
LFIEQVIAVQAPATLTSRGAQVRATHAYEPAVLMQVA